MTNLFDPPPRYTLPLAKGGDLSVDFRNNPTGDGVTFSDYEPGVTAAMIIETDPPLVAEADITDEHAIIKVESEVADLIPAKTPWRFIVTADTVPPTDTVAAYGTVRRYD
jgi:hypothetical protein